jgi:hypothetical protein
MKLKLPYLLISFCLFVASVNAYGQSCANYNVTQTTGITYNSIVSTGNIVTYWRNQTTNQNDDNRSATVPIGFDFYYCGKKYSTVSICTNGYIDFSSTVYDGNDDYWTFSGSGYQDCGAGGYATYRQDPHQFFGTGCGAVAPNYYDGTYWALAPLYTDLWTQNASQVVANNIKYQTSGVAPNRVFTVEFIHMAEWVAATSDYNFQVLLHESSGVIDFVYGNMTSSLGFVGTAYVCGINQQIFNSPALASEALVQQSPNSASFGPTEVYSQTTPITNSKVSFTPPCTTAPVGSLTFSSITQTSMTLNWTDWAANEVGYAIYYSIDGGITYNYLTVTAANATSYNATGLYYQGTYFWKLYAVTEGCISNYLSGSQAPLAGGTFVSIKSGNWSDPTLWNAGVVPDGGDNATIADGTTVTIDNNFAISNLTIGQGTSGVLIFGNSTTAYALTTNGSITVNTGGTFKTNTGFAATQLMNAYGNIINNGTFDMNPGISVCNITFLNNGNQTISGSGTITNFNNMALNMGDNINNTLEITSTNFSAPSDFLKLTNGNGTFKLSVPATAVTLNAFSVATLIPPTCKIWMNSPNSIFNCHSTLTFRGDFTCSAGTVNIGDIADESLISNGALFTITGGTVNVAGRLTRPSYVAVTEFAMSGGTLVLNTISSNDNSPAGGTISAPPFCIDVAGSTFNMTGGTMIIRNTGTGSTGNFAYSNMNCSNYNFSGGTLQIGDASTSSSGQTFHILTDNPINNLIIDNTTTTKIGSIYNMYSGVFYYLAAKGNVIIGTGSSLITNNNDFSIGGNLTNNGAYSNGTNNTTFNGIAAQSITGSTTTTFYNMIINNTNAAGVTLNKPVNVSASLNMNNGLLNTTAANILTMQDGSIASAITSASTSYVNGPMKYQKQTTGSTTLNFPVGKNADCRPFILTVNHSTTNPYNYTAEVFNANPWTVFASNILTDMPATVDTISSTHYWSINRTDGGGVAQPILDLSGNQQIQLFFGTNDNVKDGSALTIVKNTSATPATWVDIGGAGGPAFSGGADLLGSISSNSLPSTFNSFSSFSLGSKSGIGWNPLPIELLSFSAVPNGEKVDIKWETTTETNNAYFTVEKSTDGKTFTKIIDVPGAGTSVNYREYAETDYQPYGGLSYYRLKQTDKNGSFKYFPMVQVNFSTQKNISMYPNPIDNASNFTIDISGYKNQEVVVVLIDSQGREFLSRVILLEGNNQLFVVDETKSLSSGTYVVTASSNDKIYNCKLIVK